MPDRTRQRWAPNAAMGTTGARTAFTVPTVSYDEARARSGKYSPPRIGRAERTFMAHLRKVAEHTGHLVKGFAAGDIELLPTMMQLLQAYSDALKPWAVSTVKRMLGEVDDRDQDSWQRLGQAISQQLRHDLRRAPMGEVMHKLMHEQVGLVQSLPLEAAERLHKLTIQGLENSERAAYYVDEIEKTGEVTRSRAVLIARTEVARTASMLSQARATAAGITHYIWQTSGDTDVRPGHRAMQGKVCSYASPPAVNENGRIMRHHPGQIWNCRCWAEPLVESR